MPLITEKVPEVRVVTVGFVCDKCGETHLDNYLESQEALIWRTTGGYGSIWGDGSTWELVLCQRCAFALLEPFARDVTAVNEHERETSPGLDSKELMAMLQSEPLMDNRTVPGMGVDLKDDLGDWLPMESAPRDGTPIQAKIPDNGSDNIIAWRSGFVNDDLDHCYTWVIADDQEPPDGWDDGVCWDNNSDGMPSVKPTGWKPVRPNAGASREQSELA